MSEESLRKISMNDYQQGADGPYNEDIQIGCLQRIADAVVRLAAAVEKIEMRAEMIEANLTRPTATIESEGSSDAKP